MRPGESYVLGFLRTNLQMKSADGCVFNAKSQLSNSFGFLTFCFEL